MINLKDSIIKIFGFIPSKNQTRDIKRLVFEIARRERKSEISILKLAKRQLAKKRYHDRDKFKIIRAYLIALRYPETLSTKKILPKEVFFNFLPERIRKPHPKNKKFVPEKVIVEESVKASEIVRNITKLFPRVTIEYINSIHDYIRTRPFKIGDLKRPILFCTNEKWDFFKPCPCSKDHIHCGYWVFNLGFGCPFDCSYCFLQQYTNFPGLTIPANIDDFFVKFDAFEKTLKQPIRIGTGEFCDSLALDHITGYSKKLIPYFKDKNVIFELKTKSDNIINLLDIPGAKNIVISWSLNPKKIVQSEELLTATLKQRILAAKQLQQRGYSVAFHFDPIIHINNWEKEYANVVKLIYKYIKPGFAWISLGTLRCQRDIKTISERRFPKSDIFYGELLLDNYKKLRYPENIRLEIYKKMLNIIHQYDKLTPIYPCMETKAIWENFDLIPADIIKNTSAR